MVQFAPFGISVCGIKELTNHYWESGSTPTSSHFWTAIGPSLMGFRCFGEHTGLGFRFHDVIDERDPGMSVPPPAHNRGWSASSCPLPRGHFALHGRYDVDPCPHDGALSSRSTSSGGLADPPARLMSRRESIGDDSPRRLIWRSRCDRVAAVAKSMLQIDSPIDLTKAC